MSLLARYRLEQTQTRSDNSRNDSEGSPEHSFRDRSLDPDARFLSPGPAGRDLSPPPAAQPRLGQTRGRSSSLDETLEAEHRIKRNKVYALDTCRELQLEDDALNDFAKMDIDQMLISLKGSFMALQRGMQHDEAHTFIRSNQFYSILKDRLKYCLLTPNLTRYLEDLPENIWGFIKRNLGVFKIPPAAMEDPELIEHIDHIMKDILTKQRSQIKFKILTGITKEQHITVLSKSLCQKDFMDVTKSQWARFAFLRQNMITFTTLVKEAQKKRFESLESPSLDLASDNEDNDPANKEKNTELEWEDNKYWDYVDKLLDEMRDEVKEQPTMELRKMEWERYFTDALQNDLKMFPAKNKNSGLRASDGNGIAEWQRALHQELVWL